MDPIQSIINKLQEVWSALQQIEIKSTHENLQYMLACQCLIEEAKQSALELSAVAAEKESDSDAE